MPILPFGTVPGKASIKQSQLKLSVQAKINSGVAQTSLFQSIGNALATADIPTIAFSSTNPLTAGGNTYDGASPNITWQGVVKNNKNRFASNLVAQGCNSGNTASSLCIEFDFFGSAFAVRYLGTASADISHGGGATAATNASPIVITTASAHSLVTQNCVTISGATGNTAANGQFFVKVLSATTFALYTNHALSTPVAGNGTYGSGGVIFLASSAATFWIWSDDVPTSIYPSVESGVTENGTVLNWMTCTFSTAKLRRIRVYASGAFAQSVYIPPTFTALPTPQQQTNVAIIGDSWTESVGNPFYILQGVAFNIGLAMGCKHPYICGAGGTGYIATSSGTRFKFGDPRRIASYYLSVLGTLPSSGTFILTFGGHATSPLAYNVSAANLQIAIRSLPGLETVTVVGGTNDSTTNGGGYIITPPTAVDLLAALTISTNTLNAGTLVLQRVLPNNLDYIVVLGSINDSTDPSVNAIATWTALASIYPSAKIIVVGIQCTYTNAQGNQSASRVANNVSLKVAVASAISQGLPVLGYVDILTTPWMYGTGTVDIPVGDGPDDYFLWAGGGPDFAHPSYQGHGQMGRSLAGAINTLIAAQP